MKQALREAVGDSIEEVPHMQNTVPEDGTIADW